jgi:hypothetical protein
MANANRSIHPNALPYYKAVDIPREKLEGYALNPEHPVGKHHAILFKAALGFDQSNWDVLARIIIEQLSYYEAVPGRKDKYGQRYNVTMPITGPNRKTADVLTAWIIDTGQVYPRFVTAYPEE